MSFIQQFFTSRDNNANAETFVGQEGRLWWDPISNQIYSSDGNTPGGIPLAGGGGGGNPGGANSQVQFNRNGTFGGSGNLTFNVANGALTAVSFVGNSASFSGNIAADYVTANNVGSTSNLEVQSGSTYWYFNPDNTFSGTGNITAGYYFGNGAFLTGIAASSYSNANVAAYLPTYSGNLAGALLSVSGNVTGSYIFGNGSQLTGIVSSYGDSNVVTLLSSFDGHTISTTGNISAGYFIGNGSQLTGIVATSNYSNANVANFLANYGPNTISSTGNITAANVNVANYLSLGTSGAVTSALTGQMFWDVTEQTVSLGMNYGVTQQIGLESYILVRASAPITNGQVVMWTGATGEHVRAAPANMSSAGFRPGYVLGVATQDIALNNDGYITTSGIVHDLNTNAYNAGDLLYLDPASTTGGLTATEPTAPNYHIEIGTVTKKSGTGHIQVIIRINDKVSDLSDVAITSPTAGQALIYTGGNVWINGNPAAANTAGTVTTAAQPNITSVGTLTSLTSTGNISTTGNITGNYFVGNGSLLTGITSSYGNSNVVTLLASFDGNPISTTGNISAGYFNGNGSHLTSINAANVTGTVANATYATSAGAATTAATVTTAAQPNITSVGTLTSLTSTGNISTTGNISAGYFVGNGSQLTGINTSSYSNANVAAYLPTYTGNLVALTGNVTTTANVSGAYILGNGSQLTGITSSYGNANVSAYLASGTDTSNIITTANISGGNLLTGGLISATGNVTGGNVISPGVVYINSSTAGQSELHLSDGVATSYVVGVGTGLNTWAGPGSLSLITSSSPGANIGFFVAQSERGRFTNTGLSVTGIISATGNVTGGNLITPGLISATGNISSAGNITASYYIGNGYTLTSVNASNVSGQVANALVAATVYTAAQPNITSVGILTSLSVSGNITGGNTIVTGSESVTGNITGGNINTGAQVSATGNITGNYFIGNGSQLTGIIANVSYGNANVSAYLASGTDTSNIITTGNVSAGNIIGTRNVTGANVLATGFISTAGRVFAGNGVVNSPGMTFGGDIGQDTGFYLIGDGNIGVSTNGVLRASFFDTGFSVVGNITGANVNGVTSVVGGVVNGTTDTYGGNLRTAGIVNATGNITGGNLITNGITSTGTLSATGNINIGNVLTNGQVSAIGNVLGGNVNSYGDLSAIGNITGLNFNVGNILSAAGNVTGGNIRTLGLISSFGTVTSNGGANATGFAVGNAAVSNVALGMFPAAGTPGEYAIRDYSTVPTNMYFDVSIGNTSGQGGTFTFRGTSSYTTYATISSSGLNMQSLPIQGQTPYMAKSSYNVALDTVVTADNLKYRVSNQGGVFPQVASNTGGTVDVCYDVLGIVNGASPNPAYAENSGIILAANGTWVSVYSSHGMDARGDRLTMHITDKAAGKIYRVTYMRTNNSSNTDGYNIIVERIL